MRTIICGLLTLFFSALYAQEYPIQFLPIDRVTLNDKYWKPRLETVRAVTIPHTFQKSEETGRIRNFERAASHDGSFCSKYGFDDSDVYKAIEGAAYSLRLYPDKVLEAQIDTLIALIAGAQEQDGYLYTWRTIEEYRKKSGQWNETDEKSQILIKVDDPRWAKEDQHSHELYNVGHLYEAAVAWKSATGKDNLMRVALKNAELVLNTFGKGKLEKAPGHQEIELGMVKLFLATGDRKYLDMAKFFLDVRGYGESYMQNHQKLVDQRSAVGHAVRACYMYAAACDVTAYTGTTEYREALNGVWEDIVGKKMYVTGGIGANGNNEGFADPYQLPNFKAYCETCSSIAFVMWSKRMFQLTGDSRYIDVLEKTLYNALNAGLSLSGNAFFYPNPLESRGGTERVSWFDCACCPPNLTRFFSSLNELFYAKKGNALYCNLYGASATMVENVNSVGQTVAVAISQETAYPWDGHIKFTVDPAKPNTFALHLRIPGWAKGDAVPLDLYRFQDTEGTVVVKLNGQAIRPEFSQGYAVIDRKWNKGDVVELELPMPVRRVLANPQVTADAGKIALQRGPILYCLEGKDQPDARVLNMLLPDSMQVASHFEPGLFGGVQVLTMRGFLVKKVRTPELADLVPLHLKAVPYYAWANRGKDNMVVWIPNELSGARALPEPTLAYQSNVTASEGFKGELHAVADQLYPSGSNDHENGFVHWWPHFGMKEWLQYDFGRIGKASTARVYWFDDEQSGGGCRVPASWRILYLDQGEWKPVITREEFPVVKDTWNEVHFEPVTTSALRLELTLRDGVSAGVHEWIVR